MNTSVELKNAMLRFIESFSSGDVSTIEHLFSHQDGVLALGTDPSEWWAGYDTITRVHKAQLQEMGGNIKIKVGELNAFVEGTVGWAASSARFQLPKGQETPIRLTAVLHQEDKEWKIVQYHVSIGVPNIEAIGKELTTK
jgi:hypothetical protein